MRSCAARIIVVSLILAPVIVAGCNEMSTMLGPGMMGSSTLGTVNAGGTGTTIANPGTTIPTTTQPSATGAPTYAVSLLDPLLEQTAGASVVVTADLNADGLMDFVSAHSQSQPVQIHLRNSHNLEYTTYSIGGSGPLARMVAMRVADFDGDGNIDVAVLANDTGFVPVEGAEKRGAVVLLFAPADPADNLNWTETTIEHTFYLPNNVTGQIDFDVADFDGVNGPDVALMSNEIEDIKNLYLYSNPGGATSRDGAAWTHVLLEQDAVDGAVVRAADIDLDGDPDIVATYPEAKTYSCRWLTNPLAQAGSAAVVAGPWSPRAFGQQDDGGDYAEVGDIDRDGDLDVAVASVTFGLVQWFENPGPSIVGIQHFPWKVYNIVSVNHGSEINQIQLVDLNVDGQLDCYVTATGNMVGAQAGAELRDYWTPFSILATNPIATIGRSAFMDVNGDGRMDIIAPLDRDGLTQDNIAVFTRQP